MASPPESATAPACGKYQTGKKRGAALCIQLHGVGTPGKAPNQSRNTPTSISIAPCTKKHLEGGRQRRGQLGEELLPEQPGHDLHVLLREEAGPRLHQREVDQDRAAGRVIDDIGPGAPRGLGRGGELPSSARLALLGEGRGEVGGLEGEGVEAPAEDGLDARGRCVQRAGDGRWKDGRLAEQREEGLVLRAPARG